MTDLTAFGVQLAALRRSAGLSQQELAERSGLSLRAVGNLERGRARWPHPATVHRLADALGLRDHERARFISAVARRLAGASAEPVPDDQPHRGFGGPVVPRQLPAAVPFFAGRRAQLAALTDLLDQAASSRELAVMAVEGAPGVGKTALAVHWAHQASDHFPDGQLYANLQGFGPSGEIMSAPAVIRGFLDGLGVPAGRIPPGEAAQTGLYRSLLAGKRVLVVLDNVRDVAQVRPLLPGSPGCLVVVTSRIRLTGLAAAEGARQITLDVLADREAREVLARRLGAGRAAAEPDAVGELAPLPGQLFGLLGVHPGPDITVPAAAALLNTTQDAAYGALAALAAANLAFEHAPGRYGQHDLLRAYAAEQAEHEPQSERTAALRRVLDYYLHTSHAAALLLEPHRDPLQLACPVPGAAPGVIADDQQAMAWFTAEQQALALFERAGNRTGSARAHTSVAYTFDRQGRHDEALIHDLSALELYRVVGHHGGQAVALQNIGWAQAHLGDHQQALTSLQQAQTLFLALGHQPGEAAAWGSLGFAHEGLGHLNDAIDCYTRAVELNAQLGDRWSQADHLTDLGRVQEAAGQIEAALSTWREVADILDSLHDPAAGKIRDQIERSQLARGHQRESAEPDAP